MPLGNSLVISLLVAARLAPVFLSLPVFTLANVPFHFRIIFVLTLSFFLVATLQVGTDVLVTPGAIVAAFMFEVMIGAILAFGVAAAFGVFHFAGGLFDFQVGFGIANVVDPTTHHQDPLVGTLLKAMAVGSFFLVGGHHLLLKGFAHSLEHVPPGAGFASFHIGALAAQFGLMFTLGLALAMPVVIALILVDVGAGVASRFMPQMNVFMTAMPVKIFLGLAVLILTLGQAGPVIERAFASIFNYWEEVIP